MSLYVCREKQKKIADIFVKKGPFLKLYSSYIRNFQHATALLDETCKKHNGFGMALQQFEVSPVPTLLLTQSLTRSPTRSPTHSLTHSLKHSSTQSSSLPLDLKAPAGLQPTRCWARFHEVYLNIG